MTKAELRKYYLNKRKEFSRGEVSFFSKQIFECFLNQFKPTENQKVHIFLSIPQFNEVDTQLFIDYFFENNIKVYVPKVIDNQLISIEIKKNTVYELNSWNIKEPIDNTDSGTTDFDYVITPLLYCDFFGNRVGYGKGFYDRFFSKISKDCQKVGIGYFKPNEIVDDVSQWDVKLDYLVVPTEVLSFKDLL